MTETLGELLLHKQTRIQSEEFIISPSHALLILGHAGSGKKTIAEAIAAKLLNLSTGSALESYPYFIHLYRPKDKQEISIDMVRETIKKLRLKTTGEASEIRRIVLIEDADTMSIEAQNALLKMLEESNVDTAFILTAPQEERLLPTIASRTQKLSIHNVSRQEAMEYFGSDFPEADIESAWQLSQGAVGLLTALLSDNETHPIKTAVNQSKDFLRKKPYERLLLLEELTKDKAVFANFLEGLGRVIAAVHHNAVQAGKKNQSDKFIDSRKLIGQLLLSLDSNVSPRLAALELVMNLKV